MKTFSARRIRIVFNPPMTTLHTRTAQQHTIRYRPLTTVRTLLAVMNRPHPPSATPLTQLFRTLVNQLAALFFIHLTVAGTRH
jgi:hypothetical protein